MLPPFLPVIKLVESLLEAAIVDCYEAMECLGERGSDAVTWDHISAELAMAYLTLGVRRRQALLSSSSKSFSTQSSASKSQSPEKQRETALNGGSSSSLSSNSGAESKISVSVSRSTSIDGSFAVTAGNVTPGQASRVAEPLEKASRIYESLGDYRQLAACRYQVGTLWSRLWVRSGEPRRARERLALALSHYQAAHAFYLAQAQNTSPATRPLSNTNARDSAHRSCQNDSDDSQSQQARSDSSGTMREQTKGARTNGNRVPTRSNVTGSSREDSRSATTSSGSSGALQKSHFNGTLIMINMDLCDLYSAVNAASAPAGNMECLEKALLCLLETHHAFLSAVSIASECRGHGDKRKGGINESHHYDDDDKGSDSAARGDSAQQNGEDTESYTYPTTQNVTTLVSLHDQKELIRLSHGVADRLPKILLLLVKQAAAAANNAASAEKQLSTFSQALTSGNRDGAIKGAANSGANVAMLSKKGNRKTQQQQQQQQQLEVRRRAAAQAVERQRRLTAGYKDLYRTALTFKWPDGTEQLLSSDFPLSPSLGNPESAHKSRPAEDPIGDNSIKSEERKPPASPTTTSPGRTASSPSPGHSIPSKESHSLEGLLSKKEQTRALACATAQIGIFLRYKMQAALLVLRQQESKIDAAISSIPSFGTVASGGAAGAKATNTTQLAPLRTSA